MRTPSRALPLWVAALLVVTSGCDWEQWTLLNSMPVKGDPAANPIVRVYLGVDGMTPAALAKAKERGAFTDAEWNFAPFIAMFPATSDASWTRILRAPALRGYEYGHYDPQQDKLLNRGIGGLLAHVIPPFEGSPIPAPNENNIPPYYDGFDQHAAAYLDAAWSYGYPILTLYQSMDALFTTLAGRAETNDAFTGYLLQFDVIGHSLGEEAMVEAILALDDKIRAFREHHPERRFEFTMFSDHGVDFVHKPKGYVIDFRKDLEAVGVFPADSFSQGRGQSLPFAVPVLHTRVTYLSLHAPPDQVPLVAERASRRDSVDFILAKETAPENVPTRATDWWALWSNGERKLVFGYAPSRDTYFVPTDVDRARFDLSLPDGLVASEEAPAHYELVDEVLFRATENGEYPDLFYRARTALEPLGVNYPADMIVSLRHPYVSAGFELPGSAETATAGSHGAMERLGSRGTLLTNERALPSAVRSDRMLDLFPHLEEHLRFRGMPIAPGVPGAGLPHQ